MRKKDYHTIIQKRKHKQKVDEEILEWLLKISGKDDNNA